MLTPYQHELIQREIDGENTPEESIVVRELVESHPEALSLMTSLRSLDALLREVPDRATPLHVVQKIHNAMPSSPRASLHVQEPQQTFTGWLTKQWNGVTNLMEEVMSPKKALIIGTTAVAAIAIIGQALVGYTPSVFDAGTIGAGDGMSGVQQAGRYKGKPMSEKDVTLSNPQIQALFQNDQVLKLVKSDVFREAMRDESFRELQSSEAFQRLMSSDAYRVLMSNEAYQRLMASEAYQQLMSNEAYHRLMSSEAYQQLMSNEAYRETMAKAVDRQVLQSDAYRAVMANEAYRTVMKTDAYRVIMANDAYRKVMANDAYRVVMANDA